MATPSVQQLTSQAARLHDELRAASWRLACVVAARAALRIREEHPTATAIRISMPLDLDEEEASVTVTQITTGQKALAVYDEADGDIVSTLVSDDLTSALRLDGDVFGTCGDGWVSL
jgi:hypothetical protein